MTATRPAKDVGFAMTYGMSQMHVSDTYVPYEPDMLIQFAGWYHLRQFFSVGGVTSFSPGFSSHQFLRTSGEARVYAVSSRFVYVWAAGEGGLAASVYRPNALPNCSGCSGDFSPQLAPLAGVGGGIDLLPIREISIGFEGRALLPVFFGGPIGNGPTGLSPVFTAGMTLAFHLSTT